MSFLPQDRLRIVRRVLTSSLGVTAMAVLSACGGSSRPASPPHGEATLTSAHIQGSVHIEKIVIAERGSIAMASRKGCVALVHSATSQGGSDEIAMHCPKPERMKAWFDGTERVAAKLALEPLTEKDEDTEDEADPKLPIAKLLTSNGKAFRISKPADIAKLSSEVSALAAELETTEEVAPGPASASGWQMLHVSGPAHVVFAGAPARGVFEARVSTNGQYLCEFTTNLGGDGPVRAMKSGWLKPATASRAIDEVLGPFNPTGPGERAKTTYAAGTKEGSEQRSNPAATAAVFERFSQMQGALGDACLPELEPPASASIGL